MLPHVTQASLELPDPSASTSQMLELINRHHYIWFYIPSLNVCLLSGQICMREKETGKEGHV